MRVGSNSAQRYSALRYVAASRIQSPSGESTGMDFRGPDDEKIGSLDGVLIDTADHRLRFFVVESPAWHGSRRRLLPIDRPAQVSHGGRSLRMDLNAEALEACEEFESSLVRAYSDDDLLATLFDRTA